MSSREFAGDPGRVDNGLRASAYVPLTDVEPDVGEHLLNALGRARIAAYLDRTAPPDDLHRLFVASDERGDARTIVAAAVRALGGSEPTLPERDDPLAGVDTNTAFDALVRDWHVDTHAAIRKAEKELSDEDAEWRARLSQQQAAPEDPIWLDDDHYVPPPPPPLPRLAKPTIIAMTVLSVSIVLLGMGGQVGLAGNLTFVLGIAGLLTGAVMLFSRVRDHHRDDDDDGAAL